MSQTEAFIPYGRQDISAEDIDAVVKVLQSDWLTQGPAIERFEAALMEATEASHAVAVCNATAALHIACIALGVGSGDLVWTSPNSFVASANCALYCGARVDFVDIDPVTLNMSLPELEAKLAQAEDLGALPKVVIPVHFAGEPCDMAAIGGLARRYGFRVIEDASHAVGGRYGNRPVGACEHSDITVFSFHPVKIVTTGEGGAALTQDPDLARSMARLRTHGITRDIAEMTHPSEGGWYYQQIDLGLNYRMTDIQAALGASQMARLQTFVARRHAIADRYDALLADLPIRTPTRAPGNYSALHLYPVQLDEAERRKSVFDGMRAAGIGVNVLYIPIHTQPFYREVGFAPGDFPFAENYYARALALPMLPTLTDAQQDRIVATLAGLLA
jgi:UDP-4-amino-4,6-dideoxy-N-acetyl-beta-L-altrosamine transaminase